MNSRTALKKMANRASFYTALLVIISGFNFLDLAHAPVCWAGQTISVKTTDDLQTLVNQQPTNTVFSLVPGIHRLQSVVPKSYDSFVGQTGAILSGAALLTTFSQSGALWTSHVQVTKAASYPGKCESTRPACPYPEDLFFDNVLKYRAMSLSTVGPSSWYLDYGTGTIYMGDDPTGHTVEISLLRYAFAGGAISVTISNLIIEKYACVAGNGAIQGSAGSNYWAVTGNKVRYNHGIGIDTGYGMYIANNKVYDNGQLGVGGGSSGVLVENNEIYYNNYSGYSYYWEAGGAKFVGAQNLTFKYNYAHDNAGPGFWVDINSQNVLCESNQFTRNVEAGIFGELSDTLTIANNIVSDDGFNKDGTSIYWGAGILLTDSSNVSIYFNTVTNCMNGIGAILAQRGNAPDGQPYSLENVDVNNNTITQSTGIAAGIVLEGSGLTNLVYTNWNNNFGGNTYILANPTGNYFYWLGKPMPLATFIADL